MRRGKGLDRQNWLDWCHMAERTLAGASQMVWQNSDERAENNALFAKVTAQPVMNERGWRMALTWSAATLLALSTEQSMKAIAIRTRPDGKCLKTHDLEHLWNDLDPVDQQGVVAAVDQLRTRVRGTRLDQGPPTNGLDGLRVTIRHHRRVFEDTRYHLETRPGGLRPNLTENIPLWRLALGALAHAKRLAAPRSPATVPAAPAGGAQS